MIRQANIKDTDTIIELGHKAHKESPVYRKYEVSEIKFRKVLMKMMYSKRHYVGVIDRDEKVRGFLMGLVAEMPFGHEKQANDWAFYIEPEYRGHAPYLIRNFLTWAWDQKGVKMVGLSNSAGAHTEQIEMLYTKMGLHRIGGIWLDRYLDE